MSAATRELYGRCAIVTGASRGLGFEIARQYVQAGANLLICARDAVALEKSAQELRTLTEGQTVVALAADVSKPTHATQLVESAVAQFGRLDILVNNAGVAGATGPSETVDWQEWLRAIEINLLGSVLLCRAVVPYFKKFGRGKIIQVSGGGATQPLPMLSAYAASKAAVVRFAETLAEETREYHIDVNSLAPGPLNTHLIEELLTAGPQKIGSELHARLLHQQRDGGVPLRKGAALAVFLGSRLSDGITGKLLSAVWDPWVELPLHLQDLLSTDVYTVRRIVPADRNLNWGNGK